MADMTLEEALEAATVDEELISPVNEVLMINPETRTINVPDSEKLFGVRQDMSVERKYFKCPRIVGDNIDLFEHYVFVNYIPSDQNGKYESEKDVQGYLCKDLAVEGDFITFSWELTENVLRKAGYIAFAVYAKVSDENGNLKTKWHTTIAIGNVLDTLPDGEEWITIYPDIVTQLLERMDEVEKIANPESMQEYVDDYFNRNPMMIDRELKDSAKAAPADIVGKLSEEIGDLNNRLFDDEQIVNLLDETKMENAYINSNGGIIASTSQVLSDFILIPNNTKLVLTRGDLRNNSRTFRNTGRIMLYSLEKNPIIETLQESVSEISNTTGADKYCRFSYSVNTNYIEVVAELMSVSDDSNNALGLQKYYPYSNGKSNTLRPDIILPIDMKKIQGLNEEIQGLNEKFLSNLYGKKIIFFGDSFTNQTETQALNDKRYHQYISDRTGCLNLIYGESGSNTTSTSTGETVVPSFAKRAESITEECDMICIFGGINDCRNIHVNSRYNIGAIDDIWNEEDENKTFYASLKHVCEVLTNQYPTIPIVALIPPLLNPYASNGEFVAMNDNVCSAEIEVYTHYGIPFLDLRTASHISRLDTHIDLYNKKDSDGGRNNVHWNKDGQLRASWQIQDFLENNIQL